MKKKIVALMMVIPLVLMLTIFTISKTVSISVDVPVESIKITSQNDDGFLALDMATYNDDYKLEAKVFPEEAKNKNYTTKIVNLDEESSDCLAVLQNNNLALYRTGLAEIIVKSNDKGFTDSLKVSVSSSKAYDMKLGIYDDGIVNLANSTISGIDYEYSTTTGGEVLFKSDIYPKNLASTNITWNVDNKGLFLDTYSGDANKIFSGEYIVSATLKDGIKGDIIRKIKMSVDKPSGITVNGRTYPQVMMLANSNRAKFYVETDEELYDADITCLDGAVTLNQIKENCYEVIIDFNQNVLKGEKKQIEIYCGGETKTFDIEATDCLRNVTTVYDNATGTRQFMHKNGATTRYNASIMPKAEATYTWQTDSNIIDIKPLGNGSSADITAKGVGTAEFTVKTTVGKEIFTDTYSILVVDAIDNPTFTIKNNFGIKKIPTFATTKLVDGSYVRENTILSIIDKKGASPKDNILKFTSSDEKIAKVDNNGNLQILKDGVVEIRAEWKYNGYFNEKNIAKTTIAVVKDGVYVTNSSELLKATEDAKKIVLKDDINFASDFSEEQIGNLLASHKMPTTFDWHYYLNTEKNGYKRPDVTYILEFKNDVYGNGYTINTEAITNAKDGNNPKYFKGPLNFVAVEEMAAVKGQDNISFLVRTKGVKIDNVRLECIKDDSLIEGDGQDAKMELNKLNFVGTTLEVMANDVSIVNSRIKNGRTVVRIYSGNDATSVTTEYPLNSTQIEQERIKVDIESCIFSNAREFILKIGSNRGVICKPSKEGYKQYQFTDKNGVPFNSKDKTFVNGSEVNNILLTDVTLKNSILDTSGLFAVGMESHFAGPFLTGEDSQLKDTLKQYGWWNLAATSYGAVLRLEGDVRIYDWKNVKNVDSSTLIESNGKGGDTLSKIINLDIGKMISKVGKSEQYSNILSTVNGEDYVHGGIAFYGGGYNYSKLDTTNFVGEQFATYNVNIGILSDGSGSEEDLQGSMLPMAAGTEDFTFYMYNKDSKFNYDKQVADFSNGSAYDWVEGVTK